MTDEQRVAERVEGLLAALIAEFGEPTDEATAMRYVAYAYGQGYIDALEGAAA